VKAKKYNPGVGAYNVQKSETSSTFFRSNPRYSIGSAKRDSITDKKEIVPGPSQYAPNYKGRYT
jgi:hypothetical protein